MSTLDLSKVQDERAKEDIVELNDKIQSFRAGNEDEEKFRSFRLSRGVYGQRQEGVQMIRIKLPYGKVTAKQLIKIADVADKYATPKMHLTTRQDIQVHYVKMDESPLVWAELEEEGITLREACGNTVRNVTASAIAGIDPEEPFDITPYAHSLFEYFLRNPICQEMGRKFKVSFSSSEKDSGYSFMHDIGFIPVVKNGEKGFIVNVAGGLGSQPALAQNAFDFLPTDEMIPFMEACLRVFDRYGERSSRGKARMKFLVKKIGIEAFMKLVKEQQKALINKKVAIDESIVREVSFGSKTDFTETTPVDAKLYEEWFKTNVFEQKQKDAYGVYVKLTIGDITNDHARAMADLVNQGYIADDIRVTVNQGFLLKYARKEGLVELFNKLHALGLANPGFDSTADITACPGTDTCNLGIASSTGISRELERLMNEEHRDLIYNQDIKIKISGCMNACGQHSIANIGFQGMSIKKGALVMPALQLLLGGGFDSEGKPSIADKVVKLPSKRVPAAFTKILEDYEENGFEGEYFNNYYRRQVEADKMYFFQLMKPYTDTTDIPEDYYIDWGTDEKYVKAVGVGECAGVILDLVGTLLLEAEEKFVSGKTALERGYWQDSIYFSYKTMVLG
ncbi:MAG: nitrite reductase, partial [Cyclobacteriaceae bacterium]